VQVVSPKQSKKEMQTLESTAPWQPSHSVSTMPQQEIPQFSEATRRSPARPATVEGDFAVVALQALGCGVAVCILAVGATLQWDLPWWTPIMALGGGFSVAWFILLISQRKHLWIIETIIGQDIDGDGAVGEPKSKTINIEVIDPENRQIAYDVLPADEEMLRDIAIAVFKKQCAFSRRELAQATSLSENDIITLQTEMRRHGYARYKGGKPNAGTELTRKGEILLRHLL